MSVSFLRRIVMWAGVALAFLVVLVPASSAANIAPNPGFETDCSGVPCSWSAQGGSVTISRDTTVVHTGSASLKVTTTSTALGAISACITGVSTGAHNASVFYNVPTSSTALGLGFSASYYSTSDCNAANFISTEDHFFTSTNDSAWHQQTEQFTIPANTHGVILILAVSCITCGASAPAYFDDVVFDELNLAVSVASVSAHRTGKGVLVRWRTGYESNLLGFNVYRQVHGKRVKLNERLISSRGSVSGSTYSYLDRRAPRAVRRYWLQAVSVDGSKTWKGSVRVGGSTAA